MTIDATDRANIDRYQANAHGMQSGVAMEVEHGLGHLGLSDELKQFLKHERVGVNSAMRDVASLAGLLMEKGLFTQAEYLKSIADGMAEERKRYETHLSALLGKPVTLG